LLCVVLVLSSGSVALAQRGPINTLRVQPVGEGEGKALQLVGIHHVGSPCFSPDGEWIAFDAYKTTDEARIASECWIVRNDGTQGRRLTTGATPRWSPDGKQMLLMREEREDIGRPGGEKIGIF